MVASRLSPIVCVAALLLAGCRTDPYVNAHIESVNSEYRQLENKLYVAEDENRRLSADLARLQEENRRLRGGEPVPEGRGRFGRSRASEAVDGSFDLAPPEIEMGSDVGPSVDTPGIPPVTSPPIPRSPATDGVPRRSNRENLDLPLIEGPAGQSGPRPDALPAPPADGTQHQEPEPIDGRVTQIFLNPLLTGGDSLDGEPGDDGLSVLLEPRNKANEFVPQAGAISVVVLDPNKQGDAARVARWDFDSAATRQKLQRVSSTRGIHLRMPWPANPPSSNKLHVFVRYETPDGRKLQADREINVTLPGQYSHRWTPRPADRPRRSPEQVAKLTQQSPNSAEPEKPESKPAAAPVERPAVDPLKSEAPKAVAADAKASPTPAGTTTKDAPTQATRPRPQWSPYR